MVSIHSSVTRTELEAQYKVPQQVNDTHCFDSDAICGFPSVHFEMDLLLDEHIVVDVKHSCARSAAQ